MTGISEFLIKVPTIKAIKAVIILTIVKYLAKFLINRIKYIIFFFILWKLKLV